MRKYVIVLVIAGGTEFELCRVEDENAVSAVVRTLCNVDEPYFSEIRVRLSAKE